MCDSPIQERQCCIVCQKTRNDLLEISEIDDLLDLTSIQEKMDRNVPSVDTICFSCMSSIKVKPTTPPKCKNPAKRVHSSPSQGTASSPGNPAESSSPWNTIIVNQIPMNIDREKFISLFSQYGTIVDTYLCGVVKGYEHKHEKVARITFSSEDDAWRVWEVAQRKLIKYDDHVLVITVASDNYSPIQTLPTECLRMIFLNLPLVRDKFTVESVCKRWNSIGRESWSNVTEVLEDWPSSAWEKIAPRTARSLRDVKLTPSEKRIDNSGTVCKNLKNSLSLIAKYCVNLERFMLRDVPSSNNTRLENSFKPELQSIITKNKCLKRLSLQLIYDDGMLTFNPFEFFPDNIEEIQLNARHSPVHFVWKLEISKFRNLQVLALCRVLIYKLEGIETLENLRVLNFYEYSINPSDAIEKIVDLTKLEYLAIPNCDVSNDTLSRIVRNNKGLKQLDISDNTGITEVSLQYVCELEYLEVLMMRDLYYGKEMNFTQMPALHTLDCCHCVSMPDETIQQVFTPTSAISRLNMFDTQISLKSLEIANEWVLHTGKSLKIFVHEDLAEEWLTSRLENSLNIAEGFHVVSYQGSADRNIALQNDWDNYNLAYYDDE